MWELLILFSIYGANQSRRSAELVEHRGLFFRGVTYSRYDVPSEMI
jgi:hypothetical protein